MKNNMVPEVPPEPDTRYSDVAGWFNCAEIYDLAMSAALATTKPTVIVEIGCWLGRSTLYMAQRLASRSNALGHIAIYAVDTWEGSASEPAHAEIISVLKKPLFEMFLANLKSGAADKIVFPIKKSSVEASALFLDRSVDFCFIDGEHTVEAVSNDLRAWFPKIKIGGILAGDDYYWGEVRLALDYFCKVNGLNYRVVGPGWLIQL